MKIHLIAIGGAVMHNLALALHNNGHQVTGSDDEIYNPARERLAAKGLLPATEGWSTERITPDLDAVILGMHARKDNPELARAQELGLPIYSFPEYIAHHAKDKIRVVIAGSHGKTTTTSMIMHILKHAGFDFDYLVGALVEGFDTMVRLSDAPIMVIEGDEYLSSPIDPRPKIMHYRPHIAVITGVAWDHMNVFPTFENYVEQFANFSKTIENPNNPNNPNNPQPSTLNPQFTEGVIFWYKHDQELAEIAATNTCKSIAYEAFDSKLENDQTTLIMESGAFTKLEVFGQHNLANLRAAYLVGEQLGLTEQQFLSAVGSFKGAAKRLQVLAKTDDSIAYLDFAHAPSKVKATIEAMKSQFPKRKLVACLELHTFSSLNKNFLPQYAATMNAADEAVVFFNEHTLKMKKMPPLSKMEVKAFFQHPNLRVFTDNQLFTQFLEKKKFKKRNLLLMTSGTFVGLDLKQVATHLLLG
jgi:UDP-N-acetylmuramate: L-alanyl-gamma-D-glutamyl-meso-diaminopimelate ligase